MITIPKSNPARAKAIVIATGLVSILVARFMPTELETWRKMLDLLGVAGVFTGGVTIVPPRHGGP